LYSIKKATDKKARSTNAETALFPKIGTRYRKRYVRCFQFTVDFPSWTWPVDPLSTRAGIAWSQVRFDTISIVFTNPPSLVHQQDAFFDGRAN